MKKIFESVTSNAEQAFEIQIDATYIKAHQHSAGTKKGVQERSMRKGLGKSKGGFTSKMYIATDENKKTIRILITDGSMIAHKLKICFTP